MSYVCADLWTLQFWSFLNDTVFFESYLGALEKFCMYQKLMSQTLTSGIHWSGQWLKCTMAKLGLTDVSPGGVPKSKYKFLYFWGFWSNIFGPGFLTKSSGSR